MSKREYSLDLIRCFSTLLVVMFHGFMSNGYTIQAQVGISMWLGGSFRLMGLCGVGIFLMLSGYLQSKKTDWRACYRTLPSVILGYLLISFISIPIRHFVFGDEQSLFTWLQRLFGSTGAYYGWYVEMYVGLTLLTPFINLSLKQLSTKGLLGFSAILLFLSALPGLTPWVVVPSFYQFLYPVSFYVLGAIFRRVQPKIHPLAGLGAALASALVMGAGTVLSTDGVFSEAITWSFGDLGMVIVSVGLFAGMYRLKLPTSLGKFLAFAGTGSYGAYMLSHLLDAQFYRFVMPWRREGRFLLIFLCVSVPIYIASMVMGIGLDRIVKLLLSLGQKIGNRLKIGDKLKAVCEKKLPQS
jgi:surface polysaccharide O-acyltransferase-like enzyme